MKRLLVTVCSVFVALGLAAAGLEVWVRARWDPALGTPGLYLSDAVRGERLAADYSGWFAGVPVRLNRLGFRDSREYALAKTAATFRILVLGDSVTFGQGCVYEHTWPYLLEQRLRAWRPEVDWQVWNLGVPGYNTSQELAYLLEAGPRFKPDLVLVAFFEGDILNNDALRAPSRAAVLASAVRGMLRRHVYVLHWYKRRDAQERLLARPSTLAEVTVQRLTQPRPMTDAEIAQKRCTEAPRVASPRIEETPGFAAWDETVERLQRLHREGLYRIAFFINAAPARCVDRDAFDASSTKAVDDQLLSRLSRSTPAVSSHDAFLRFRPSEMPGADGHSLGNANVVKADVIARFLRDQSAVIQHGR